MGTANSGNQPLPPLLYLLAGKLSFCAEFQSIHSFKMANAITS